MVDCTFCGKLLVPGTGKLYVKKDGKQLFFCSNKCKKHLVIKKHRARKVKWTKEAALEKEAIKKKT